MAFDFPASPALHDEFLDTATGVIYAWNGYAWARKGSGSTAVPPAGDWVEEAPLDGVPYARMDGVWVASSVSVERPVLNSIDPATALVTAADLTVSAHGSKFTARSQVFIGIVPAVTTYVSPTRLSFPLSPATLGVDTVAVTVNNGGLSSQPRAFTIT